MAAHCGTKAKTLWQVLPENWRQPSHSAVVVQGLVLDSRQVEQGDVFVALKGYETDGRQYIPQAVARGCSAVIAEAHDFATLFPPDGTVRRQLKKAAVPMVLVEGLQRHVSGMAAAFYEEPARHLAITGITGTNGKTTCASLIGQLQKALGHRAAVIGTLGYGQVGESICDTGMTTPDAIRLQRILSELMDQGVETVAMEVSSHSLDQHRADDANIATAVYTNLSRDHLDYHGDEASYAEAKARLFALPSVKFALINGDDAFGKELKSRIPDGVSLISYGLNSDSDIRAERIEVHAGGVRARLVTPWGSAEIQSPLLGQFNLYNLMAAIGAVCAWGADFSRVVQAIPELQSVSGRMETINADTGATVVVDYAHTPDALEKALATLRHHCRGRLWCIVGCGGDRDRGKRPHMAAIAVSGADDVIFTSDNPRSENPQSIIADMTVGLSDDDRYMVVVDRREAIARAVESAGRDDMILIAGKGHENYQQIGSEKRPFSDQSEARSLLAAFSAVRGSAE
jgi:UDP-N-acetylmuramoyl-L-alanyl-D-glutamate--2,6-diaminopimelate ligase